MTRDSSPRLVPEASAVADKTNELSELLVGVLGLLVGVLGVTDVGARFPHRVTYHPTCHGLWVLRLGDKPLRLLRAVDGIELLELGAAAPRPSAVMSVAAWLMRSPQRYAAAERLARYASGALAALLDRRSVSRLPWPVSAWTDARAAPLPAAQSFRDWWRHRADGPSKEDL